MQSAPWEGARCATQENSNRRRTASAPGAARGERGGGRRLLLLLHLGLHGEHGVCLAHVTLAVEGAHDHIGVRHDGLEARVRLRAQGRAVCGAGTGVRCASRWTVSARTPGRAGQGKVNGRDGTWRTSLSTGSAHTPVQGSARCVQRKDGRHAHRPRIGPCPRASRSAGCLGPACRAAQRLCRLLSQRALQGQVQGTARCAPRRASCAAR